MQRFLHLALLLSIGFCASCSSPRIITNTDPNADFAAYSSYGFAEDLGTNLEDYESLETQFLKVAVGRELEARGYTPSDAPDLLVNFYVLTKEKVRTTSTPSSYYGYRGHGGYGTWGGHGAYETTTTQYTEGTLNIDLIDRGRMQLVWEGAIIGTLTDKERKNIEQTIDTAVANVFEHYPFVAPPR